MKVKYHTQFIVIHKQKDLIKYAKTNWNFHKPWDKVRQVHKKCRLTELYELP